MSIGQTSYAKTTAIAYKGMKGDASIDVVTSYVNAEATASIPFGSFVSAGGSVGDGGAILPTSSANVLGVVLAAHNYARTFTDASGVVHGEVDATGLVPTAVLNVMAKGRVWVTSELAAVVGDPVFVRYSANGGNTVVGAVTNASDSGHTLDLTAKARFVTSCANGGLAMIEVDVTG